MCMGACANGHPIAHEWRETHRNQLSLSTLGIEFRLLGLAAGILPCWVVSRALVTRCFLITCATRKLSGEVNTFSRKQNAAIDKGVHVCVLTWHSGIFTFRTSTLPRKDTSRSTNTTFELAGKNTLGPCVPYHGFFDNHHESATQRGQDIDNELMESVTYCMYLFSK